MEIAILSFAHLHAWNYAQQVRQVPDARLAAIWDDNAERGWQAAQANGCLFEPDLDKLLAMDIQAVIVTAENVRHKDLVLKAAAAGKHILCEKPIATTVADAETMIAACKKAGVQLMTAFPVRYSPPAIRAKQAIEAGRIGEVLAIKGANRGKMPGGWFTDKAMAGGGAVMDHTVHVVDLIRWFLNKEIVSVYAEIGTRFHEIPIDDCGMLTMELEGGVFATLDPSWSRPPVYPTWGDVTLEIVGTEGTISVDAFGQNIDLYNNEAKAPSRENYASAMNGGLVADFVRCCAENRPVSITGEDGLRALEVAILAYESAAKGEVVYRK